MIGIKYVVLNEIKKYETGANKNNFNWKESIGAQIPFEYENQKGVLEIVGFLQNGKHSKVRVKLVGSDLEDYILCDSLKRGKIGRLLKIYTSEFKIQIGTTFKDNKRDITITNCFKELNKNQTQKIKYYNYKCNICGYEGGKSTESNILNGCGCACCVGQTVVEGINDIPTTASWMVKYFQGGIDEAKKYTKNSSQRIKPVCPDCGRVRDKYIHIYSIYDSKTIGCECSDGFSYSEKFVFHMLKQLNLNVITQASKKNLKWVTNGYRYDFYLPDYNIIIETHGLQHYQKITNSTWSGYENQKKIDLLKQELAIKNNITNYIVLDCRYSDYHHILKEIKNSLLSDLFDLSKIHFEECEKYARSNLLKLVVEYWNTKKYSTYQISKITNLNVGTVIKYLKIANKINLCEYSNDVCQKRRRYKVELFKNGISFGVFNSLTELSLKSEELFGVHLNKRNLSSILNGHCKTHKGFTIQRIY